MRRRTGPPFRGAESCPPGRYPLGSAQCARGNSPGSGSRCKASSLLLLWGSVDWQGRPQLAGGWMPDKGPRVFLDYDQAALDAAYDQAAYAPNREQLIKRRI